MYNYGIKIKEGRGVTSAQVITLVGILIASNGVWNLVMYLVQRRDKNKITPYALRKDVDEELAKIAEELLKIKDGVVTLQHDRLYQIFRYYSSRSVDKEMSVEEFENLQHLHRSYNNGGGNHTGDILYQKLIGSIEIVDEKGDIL